MEGLVKFSPLLAIGGLVLALFIYLSIKKRPDGNEKMRDIAALIHDGAMVYLKRQYTILVVFIIIAVALLAIFIDKYTAIAYIGGAVSSMLAGFFGMKGATKANVRTAQAANLFKPNAAKALSTASLGLLGVGVLFIIFGDPSEAAIISGYAMGASSIALFARVGGGIFTKAADVGSDLAGKIEAGVAAENTRTTRGRPAERA